MVSLLCLYIYMWVPAAAAADACVYKRTQRTELYLGMATFNDKLPHALESSVFSARIELISHMCSACVAPELCSQTSVYSLV